MNAPRSAPPELPGFTFVRGLGGGGFADVFLYAQQRPARQVAVKVLRTEHTSPAAIRQFEVEADVMAEVSAHPYIVTIYDVGIAPDGRPYLVMEYYSQPHFGVQARGGALRVADVLRVGIQVSSAVETAHRAGILHRDIKPANILTSAYGKPGLTDFGIAGVRREGVIEAAQGVSIAYAPPEVLSDDDLTGSEAGDVYSLTATIYSLLAGHSPFWVPSGENGETALVARILSGQAPAMARDDVPDALRHLLRQGMAPDRSHRPPTALALARSFQDIEQQLHLAPTPLEVLDAGAKPEVGGAPGRTGDGDDGTRRAGVRMVDPQPGPPTPTPVPPSPPKPPGTDSGRAEVTSHTVQRGASQPPMAPAHPDGGPTGGPASAGGGGDTVLRPGESTSEPPAPDPAGRRPPWAMIGGIAALVVLVVGVAAFALSSGTGTSESPTTTIDAGPPSTLVRAAPPAPPAPTLAFDAGGSLVVTIPVEATTVGVRFRVSRTDGTWPDGTRVVDSDEPQVTVPGLPVDEPVCVTVSALDEGGVLSPPSPEACTPPP